VSYLVVLPVVDPFIARACIRYLAVPGEQLIVVDNTPEGLGGPNEEAGRAWDFEIVRDPDGKNFGVAASWNLGAQRVLSQGLDWLIIASAAFIPTAGLLDLMQVLPADPDGKIWITDRNWHLRPVHRLQFESVGLFDEGFYPAYYEDMDFERRLALAGWLEQVRVPVAGVDLGAGHGTRTIPVDYAEPRYHYRKKWGGLPGREAYVLPWNGAPPA